MKQYLDLLRDIMENGVDKTDRTGTGTRSVFGRQCRYDLSEGFPLVTTKKVFLKGIIYELLWFIKGDTNIRYLQEHKVHIWDEWADEKGDLGPVYGAQWRNWNGGSFFDSWGAPIKGIDQLAEVVERIKKFPNDRRLIITAWNPSEIGKMALPPCHMMFQFYVANNKLSCMLYQRSCDCFLGVPFNIASYALLTMMIAQVCGYQYGEFIHTLGDTHIYSNHFEQVKLQLTREPRPLPKMLLNPEICRIDDFDYGDFELTGYDPYPAIKGEVSV